MIQIDDSTWAIQVSPLMHKTYANFTKVVQRIPNHGAYGWRRLRIDREYNGRKGCWWILQAIKEPQP